MNSQTMLLNSLYQNTSMAKTTLKNVINKVSDSDLNCLLRKQLNSYQKTSDTLKEQLTSQNQKPSDISMFSKSLINIGLDVKCINDKSPQHISEILIQGTNMGIIDINKNINSAKNVSPQIIQEAKKLLIKEQKYLDTLKTYL